MSKNGLIAALCTMCITFLGVGIMFMIRDYQNLGRVIAIIGVVVLVFFVVIYPLWDTIKWELDERDKRKREAHLKEMMKKDEECGLYNFDLDENDKAQIG